MVETIPITIPDEPGRAVASYDYTDIAEGTGIQAFYAFTADASGSLTLHLSGEIIDAGITAVAADIYPQRSLVTSVERIFELTGFNLPKIIKGTGYVNFTWAPEHASGTFITKVKVRIYKNTTELVTATTSTKSIGSGNTIITSNLKLIIPRTNFKKNDQLKISFEGIIDSGDGHIYVYHDPINRDFTQETPNVTAATNTTICKGHIPFVLDI